MPPEQAVGDTQSSDGNQGLDATPGTLRGRKISLALGWSVMATQGYPIFQPLCAATGVCFWPHLLQPQLLQREETLQES